MRVSRMKLLDLFSGIGGFSYGLEKTGGFETAAFCEIDPYARAVLNKHWPDVPCYEDVRTLTSEQLAADGVDVDVITGGFPCQDISTSGKGAGIAGERSGLWSEIARLTGELRPSYVIVENVSVLRGRGLSTVLGDLSEIGYDAEWHCIPASYVGAPHRRDRIWIIAYPTGWDEDDVAHSGCRGSQGQGPSIPALHPAPCLNGEAIKPIDGGLAHIWSPEPDVGRVAHGIPRRVDRLKCLGNSLVPQIPEMIGRAILQAELR